MSKKKSQEVQYCDDCGEVLGMHVVIYVVLPFDVSSANKGESACICGDCHKKHLDIMYKEINDTK
jgi:hypothetical protein